MDRPDAKAEMRPDLHELWEHTIQQSFIRCQDIKQSQWDALEAVVQDVALPYQMQIMHLQDEVRTLRARWLDAVRELELTEEKLKVSRGIVRTLKSEGFK